MSQRLFAALLLLSVCPLVLLGWISSNAILSEEVRAKESLNTYFKQSLSPFVVQSESLLSDLEASFLDSIRGQQNLQECLSDLRRSSPLVKATLWIARDGTLLYPEIPEQVDTARAGHFALLHELVRNRPLPQAGETIASESTGPSKGPMVAQSVNNSQFKSIGPAFWMPWYQQQGLQLVLWIPIGEGELVGILLDRSAWISRLIAALPDTVAPQSSPIEKLNSGNPNSATRTRLIDSQGVTIYQWGTEMSLRDDVAEWFLLSEVSLAGPLSPWRLRYESLAPLSVSSTSIVPLVVGLSGIGLMFLLLGIYIVTSMKREMKLAAQHVSFAGQVSHELRTPLTNIRLYAEMAIDELKQISGDQENSAISPTVSTDFRTEDLTIDHTIVKVKQRLLVIERETMRLGRLCSSVLELLKQPQHTKASKTVETDVYDCVDEILDQFRPTFEKAGFVINLDVDSTLVVRLDRDALEMVVVNLISNVEKYALDGKWLRVFGRVDKQKLRLVVQDRGSGIPSRKREAVFRPFVRLDSSISAPSGTGIGLSIARQAARRAGGELRLLDGTRKLGESGATFELELPIDEDFSCGR